jgi:chromosome partitioning protein
MDKGTVWVVGGQKGGSAKSTIAENLAVTAAHDGRRVLIIDTDVDQHTSSNWYAERVSLGLEPALICVIQKGLEVGQYIDEVRGRYDLVVVDTGASDTEELRVSVVRAQLFIAPLQPSQADMWTIRKVNEVATGGAFVNPDLRSLVVLTRVPTDRTSPEAAAAIALVKEFPALMMASTSLYERIAYKRALAGGYGLIEYKPTDDKAADEVRQLYAEVTAS